jgi:hypothetical protein
MGDVLDILDEAVSCGMSNWYLGKDLTRNLDEDVRREIVRLRKHNHICCVCLFIETNIDIGPCQEAITIINGYAVCYKHLRVVVKETNWDIILQIARGEKWPAIIQNNDVNNEDGKQMKDNRFGRE